MEGFAEDMPSGLQLNKETQAEMQAAVQKFVEGFAAECRANPEGFDVRIGAPYLVPVTHAWTGDSSEKSFRRVMNPAFTCWRASLLDQLEEALPEGVQVYFAQDERSSTEQLRVSVPAKVCAALASLW